MTGTRPGPPVIELMGPPGAGKSTVASLLADFYLKKGRSVITAVESGRELAAASLVGRAILPLVAARLRPAVAWELFAIERWFRGWLLLLRNPGLATILWRTQRGRPEAAQVRRRGVLRWWLRMAGGREIMVSRAASDSVVLVDEGFCHRVVQLFSSEVEAADRAVIDDYLSRVPLPSLVLEVAAPLQTCLERVLARGVWDRYAGLPEASLEGFLANAGESLELTVQGLAAAGVRTITIDNGPHVAVSDLSHHLAASLQDVEMQA